MPYYKASLVHAGPNFGCFHCMRSGCTVSSVGKKVIQVSAFCCGEFYKGSHASFDSFNLDWFELPEDGWRASKRCKNFKRLMVVECRS